MPYMETHMGNFILVTREGIEKMTRNELVEYLESRGTACYDDETTADLRECAIEDLDC